MAMGKRMVRGKGVAALAAIAAGALFAVPAVGQSSEPPAADLGVVSIHASTRSAERGMRVTFTEVIRNNGPETAELDTVPQIRGGVLVGEACDAGVSPDTPFCEYGDVAPGTSLTTRFVVRVTATHGSVVVKGGVLSEAPFQDDNPFNQYRTARVRVRS
jgi:Domain of unknown function DUF11